MSKETVITFKGFDQKLQCRGFQFEMGGTFEHEGEVEACATGFHACEYPLDCFGYYEPASSVYAVCEQSGDLSRHDDDSKIASRKISLKAEITIPGLIKAAIEYTTERCTKNKADHVKGNRSASSATGYQSASSATGDQSASSATGDQSASSATGYQSSSEITPADDGRKLHAVASALGDGGKARAPLGSAIVCVYRNDDGELIHIRASKVGENGIMPDAWYSLNEIGEFEEA
ncbi:DUF7666 domain-containing protein [Yersinia rohdei]|uniref:DUF7666 domain-containing protein n=1 Tax=Yersinia rohdei TaxID=29485 RepID=UPI0011A8BD2F|nr:hypothetical protein [Yersinia rohdei]